MIAVFGIGKSRWFGSLLMPAIYEIRADFDANTVPRVSR